MRLAPRFAMPVIIDQLRDAIEQTKSVVEALDRHFIHPELVEIKGKLFFRHKKQNDLLLSQLKCIRAVSSLNACIVLLEHGFVQEIGTLCRCIDDFYQDVLFLASPLGESGPSEQQKRLVEEFFQEEFDNIDNPLRSTQVRNRVPRSKVLAGIARMLGQPLNPNDAQEIQRTLQQGFSGYVHGAYVHIMEIYGGSRENLHYHMKGLSGTPRISEWIDAFSNYVYRTMIAVEVVAMRCEDAAATKAIQTARMSLEEVTGLGKGDPNEMLGRLKSRKLEEET